MQGRGWENKRANIEWYWEGAARGGEHAGGGGEAGGGGGGVSGECCGDGLESGWGKGTGYM